MGDISKSFFIGLDPELYPSMLALYDGSFIHAFDLRLGIEVCSKEIECFTLETSSKYITGHSKNGIVCFNPQTGALWCLQDYQPLDGQLSKVNIFGQFHNFESSFVLQCEKTIYGLKTSICEVDDYGHKRTFSTMFLPCGQVHHCETKGRDFYLFTDRGVFMTDTFEYFE